MYVDLLNVLMSTVANSVKKINKSDSENNMIKKCLMKYDGIKPTKLYAF